MTSVTKRALRNLLEVGPRYLPFADAASDTLPLSRLLRLSLFQVSVGMALVLMVGTLNRVMIVELDVPASLVGLMISLPLVFAPFRALIGHKSDTYVSALGWRRIPYIWYGTLAQWGGFAIMPFALLALSGKGPSADWPAWIGQVFAALSFLLVGAGAHTVQTVGLALATDLAPQEDQPKVVGLMYVMLLVGMIIAALGMGALLTPYTPGKLIQVVQGAALISMVLNVVAMWKQEPRDRARALAPPPAPEFWDSWRSFISRNNALRGLVVIGLGTLGFGMADVLLEPYGGQVLGITVAGTTKLTAVFAGGGLIGFAYASRVLSRGADPLRMAALGALLGLPGFGFIMAASPASSTLVFVLGTLMVGFGGGLFSHGTLTATMRLAPKDQVGLALGAWGSVQATAAGVGIASAGVIRDVTRALPLGDALGPATPYAVVFFCEMLFLALALAAIRPLIRGRGRSAAEAAVGPGGTAP